MWFSEGRSYNGILEAVPQACLGCQKHHQRSAQGWLPTTAPAFGSTNPVGDVTSATIQAHVVSFPPNGIDCGQLNVDITLVEVQQAFQKLKRHKATSIDGIKPKFLLDAATALQQPLLIVFNKILREGYCESFSVGIIHALYKGGDYSQFDNYKGITVGPVLAKVFVMILESRIS